MDYSGIDFRRAEVKAFVHNAYIYELAVPGKWANRASTYLLHHYGEGALSMDLWFAMPEAYSAHPLNLSVYVNRELVSLLVISRGGEQAFEVRLKGVQGDMLELTLVSNASITTNTADHANCFMILNLQLVP
ncbi:MAG TPA: hypothetical protein PLO92_09075 [Anaerolineaceae bacterium]|nr:hypothetical protein [Anaerolineaceae bacterium]HQC21965.1 hypothetical protein [Anaerolineaceae bacterium]